MRTQLSQRWQASGIIYQRNHLRRFAQRSVITENEDYEDHLPGQS